MFHGKHLFKFQQLHRRGGRGGGRRRGGMPKKKGGGKKGGGKKGGGGGWVPREVPDGPLMLWRPHQLVTVEVRGVLWQLFDCTLRLPAVTTVGALSEKIAQRQGAGRVDFSLYKERVEKANLLTDPFAALCDLEFSGPCGREHDHLHFFYVLEQGSFWSGMAQTIADGRTKSNRPMSAGPRPASMERLPTGLMDRRPASALPPGGSGRLFANRGGGDNQPQQPESEEVRRGSIEVGKWALQ